MHPMYLALFCVNMFCLELIKAVVACRQVYFSVSYVVCSVTRNEQLHTGGISPDSKIPTFVWRFCIVKRLSKLCEIAIFVHFSKLERESFCVEEPLMNSFLVFRAFAISLWLLLYQNHLSHQSKWEMKIVIRTIQKTSSQEWNFYFQSEIEADLQRQVNFPFIVECFPVSFYPATSLTLW